MDWNTLIFGQAGIALIVAGAMEVVKKQWPDVHKNIYFIIAGILSLGFGAGSLVFWGMALAFDTWIALSLAVFVFQLFENNEAWPKIKQVLLWILNIFGK